MRYVGLFVVALTLGGCAETFVAPTVDTSAPAVFEDLWREFDQHYAVFAERHVDWDSLHAIYAPRVRLGMPDSDLFFVCDSLLAPFRDAHIGLITFDPRHSARFEHTDSTSEFSASAVSSWYLGEGAQTTEDGYLRYGLIHDSIGYLSVLTFSLNPGTPWTQDIDRALAAIWNAKALIVDLRGNFGGAVSALRNFLARFIQENKPIAYVEARYDGDRSHLTSPRPMNSIAPTGALWTKPLVALTDRTTTSAAEWCTMALKAHAHATQIGDTTQGAMSGREDRELANGWTYSLSIERVSDANHVCHEGVGIVPEIEVYLRQHQSTSSHDPALDRAIEFLEK